MKIKLTCILCLLAMMSSLFLSGCSTDLFGSSQSESSNSSQSSESSQEQSEPSAEPSSEESSSNPSSEESQSEESESSIEESSSSESSSGAHSSILPDISADDPAFAVIFAENPVDKSYTEELENAASTSKMIGIINEYIDLWKAEVDAAYQTLMQKTTGDAKAAIKAEHEEWVNGIDSHIASIQENTQGEGSSRQLDICNQILAYYRARAASLYSQLFQIDPDFSFKFTSKE